MTVHKAQGSEFPGVVIVLTTHHYMLLQRNLLYTALTRGRRLVVLLGSKRALGMAIHNDRPIQRYTNLSALLQEAIKKTETNVENSFTREIYYSCFSTRLNCEVGSFCRS